MMLTVKERILILNVLPKEGDFVTQKIVRQMKDTIGLSEKDLVFYEVKTQPNGMVIWNAEKDKGSEIELGAKAKEIIGNGLKELDKNKKVTDDFMSLFEKFLPDYDGQIVVVK